MKIPLIFGAFGAAVTLSGCMELRLTNVTDISANEMDLRPPDAEPGACYGKEVSPAVIETVTQQVITRAARYDEAGNLVTPASYRTETVQKILHERQDIWFKTPCSEVRVGEFTASVQRALKVRGLYHGRITGVLDGRTKRAIRKYQLPELDSETLSLASARKLGLVAVERVSELAE